MTERLRDRETRPHHTGIISPDIPVSYIRGVNGESESVECFACDSELLFILFFFSVYTKSCREHRRVAVTVRALVIGVVRWGGAVFSGSQQPRLRLLLL